jgi:hypothetical protein
MSAHISTLQEAQWRLLTRLEKMEARVNALENPPEDEPRAGNRAKKTAAGSRGSANEHPSVKVSQQSSPPMTLQPTHLYTSPLSTCCSMKCVG